MADDSAGTAGNKSRQSKNPSDQSPKELVTAVAGSAVELAHLELQLAKAEVSERLEHGLAGIGWIVVGAALFSAAIITLVRAAVDGLAPTLPDWAASVLVGISCLIIAAASFWAGIRRFARTSSVSAAEKREMEKDKQLVEESLQ